MNGDAPGRGAVRPEGVDAAASSPLRPPPSPMRSRSRDWRELLRFLPDVGRLLADVARDPRVPRRAKLVAGAVGLYLFSQSRDSVLQLRSVDDLAVLMWGMRQLLRAAGYDMLHELWPGSEDGFVLLLLVAGIER